MNKAKEPENIKEEEQEKQPFSWRALAKELCIYAMIAVLSFLIIPKYVAEGVTVKGESMESTLDNRDRLITEKITTQFGEIKRFDIVIFDPHNDIDKYWIKRVIGLPGETIQIIGADIYINGEVLEEDYGKDPIDDSGFVAEPYTLAEDEYFVLGDNRCNSTDSRHVGPIKKNDIEGRACFCLWPLSDFGVLEK